MPEILDLKCAIYGSAIAGALAHVEKDAREKVLNNALDVLREDGVYAMFLYLEVEKKTQAAAGIRNNVYNLLKDGDLWPDLFTEPYSLDKINTGFANNLDKLLLAKELLENTLVYARYHVKAAGALQQAPAPQGGA